MTDPIRYAEEMRRRYLEDMDGAGDRGLDVALAVGVVVYLLLVAGACYGIVLLVS